MLHLPRLPIHSSDFALLVASLRLKAKRDAERRGAAWAEAGKHRRGNSSDGRVSQGFLQHVQAARREGEEEEHVLWTRILGVLSLLSLPLSQLPARFVVRRLSSPEAEACTQARSISQWLKH